MNLEQIYIIACYIWGKYLTMNKIILLLISITLFGCEITNIDYLMPIMGTDEPSSILTNSAVLGGKVLGEGGKDIFEYGVVWSETFPPTIEDNKMIEGERIGWFSGRYEGLKSNTTYYYSSYGINEVGVGYGEVYEFKTNSEPICAPAVDNRINTGNNVNGIININNVISDNRFLGFNDGNIQFETETNWSSVKITLQFNEIDGNLPLTGEYSTVYEFNNQSEKSNGEVKLSVSDWDIGSLGGGGASPNEKVYIENDNLGNITFIFCDVYVNEHYTINGKYTYNL
tara:strand:+ start:1976 stop:2830 length:855 start_codon:yes stop_codon:yes gene_type:complete